MSKPEWRNTKGKGAGGRGGVGVFNSGSVQFEVDLLMRGGGFERSSSSNSVRSPGIFYCRDGEIWNSAAFQSRSNSNLIGFQFSNYSSISVRVRVQFEVQFQSRARREREGQRVRVQFEFTFRQVHFLEGGGFDFSSSSRSHRK